MWTWPVCPEKCHGRFDVKMYKSLKHKIFKRNQKCDGDWNGWQQVFLMRYLILQCSIMSSLVNGSASNSTGFPKYPLISYPCNLSFQVISDKSLSMHLHLLNNKSNKVIQTPLLPPYTGIQTSPSQAIWINTNLWVMWGRRCSLSILLTLWHHAERNLW